MERAMDQDEARDLFSRAYDGELSAEQQEAFDALLDRDRELAGEWSEFRDMLNEAQTLADGEDDLDFEAVDLLAGVQSKIRARSRGRFYKDRFAARTGGQAMMPLLLGIVMLVLLAVTWFALTFTEIQGGANSEAPAARTSPP